MGFFKGIRRSREDFAPERSCVEYLNLAVYDVEVHGRAGLALQDDGVPAGEFELRAEVAARVGTGDGAGQRRLGNRHVAAAGGCGRTCQRAGDYHQLVGGRQRVDFRIDLVHHHFGAETAAAYVFACFCFVQGLDLDCAGRKIDAQDLSIVTVHIVPLWIGMLPSYMQVACQKK